LTTDAESKPVRVLLIEDLEVDAERALYQLKRAGITCDWLRVQTGPALVEALEHFRPDVILSDFSLPQFDGMEALSIARERAPQVPFLFLSGTIGEERAIHALHSGAVDYVLKDNLARLAPAVRRALAEAAARAERARQEAQIARLHRVLRMLSGVNSLVLRIRDRTEVLRETCRLATSAGGYSAAIAVGKVSGGGMMQPMAWSGEDTQMIADLRAYITTAVTRENSVLAKVIATGREFVCNNTVAMQSTGALDALMVNAGVRSVVALPLVVDGVTVGLLVLAARDAEVVGEEELGMLREVSGNLSFGLKYLQRDTKARFLSHFDANTGLAKRPLFSERVQRLITSPAAMGNRHVVIVMDVERLSIINDSIGWESADLLLQQVAERLRKFVPRVDQLGHFGGGTFALVRQQGQRSIAEVHAASYRRASQIFGEPFVIDGQSIPVVVRTGFALYPDDDRDAATLVQDAEAALRHARSTGEQHVHYDATVRSQGVDRLALEHRLRFALERREFELHYQPKVDVATRRIIGAEALLRWRSPEEGLVMPGLFLPLLEATGMVVEVGDWVVRQAASDCQGWLAAGLPPVRIAVNIAPAQLRHPQFAAEFLHVVESWSTPQCGLDIEITEGLLHEDSVAEVDKLRQLHDRGVRIAIDDFGTGYSSLTRLAQLPIDTLKIDRQFISRLLGGSPGNSVVRTIIALAGAFGMTTVAEGVETPEQLAVLCQLGCQQSQGYLHSRAVPAADFARMLAQGDGAMLQPAAGRTLHGVDTGHQPAP
jgi:diguanylate cyclase (GGDEF)-like protein